MARHSSYVQKSSLPDDVQQSARSADLDHHRRHHAVERPGLDAVPRVVEGVAHHICVGAVQLPEHTADLVVPQRRVGGIHHHDKLHPGVGHVAVSAQLVREGALARALCDSMKHSITVESVEAEGHLCTSPHSKATLQKQDSLASQEVPKAGPSQPKEDQPFNIT